MPFEKGWLLYTGTALVAAGGRVGGRKRRTEGREIERGRVEGGRKRERLSVVRVCTLVRRRMEA